MQEPILADDPIQTKFRELKSGNDAALITYLTGGDPDFESFQANSATLIEGGADIVEVGIPFSDPIADGPVIQASSGRALSNGATPARVLDAVKDLSVRYRHVPFVVLTYYNPILGMGVEDFLSRCRDSGVSGLIVPDLPVEEADGFRDAALKHRLDHICQVAPNTSKNRILEIIERTRGFLYLVSLYGVTGTRGLISPIALETVRRVREMSKETVPIAVGFGVSSPDHVASYARSGADGVIVGSALVEIVSQDIDRPSQARNRLKKLTAELKNATRNIGNNDS